MRELAIFGIVMMVIIAIVFQHLCNWAIREAENDGGSLAIICFALSIFLLGLSFNLAVKLF